MARSIGEAIATGLDTGFSRVQQYQAQREAKERQDSLDEQRAESSAAAGRRQADADSLASLNSQEAILKEEGLGYANSATPPDQGTQQDFARRVQGLRQAKGSLLSKSTGFDFTAAQKAGKADLKALQEGKVDIESLSPGQLARMTTVSTGRDPADYIRPQGGMAPIEKAGMNVIEGLQGGDMGRVISGLNVLHAPDLRSGVGSDGKHGKIVSKQIVNVVPDPNSNDPDNPRVIPIMRIYVNSGKDFRGPIPPDVPEGSTGYYDAPLTERRSSDPDDPVKSVGMKDFMERLGAQMKTVEMMNSPGVVAKLRQDQEAWNPEQYLQALGSLGAKPNKQLSTKMTPIPAGGSILEQTTDQTGKVVSERRIEGNLKQAAAPRSGSTQEKIDAINGQRESNGGPLSDEEADLAIRGLAKTISTRATGSRSGGGGGSGNSVQSTKVGADGDMIAIFRDGTSKKLLIDGKPIKSQDYVKRIDKLASDMGKSIDGIGRSSKEIRAEAESTLNSTADVAGPAASAKPAGKPGGLSKDEAAKKFGF